MLQPSIGSDVPSVGDFSEVLCEFYGENLAIRSAVPFNHTVFGLVISDACEYASSFRKFPCEVVRESG